MIYSSLLPILLVALSMGGAAAQDLKRRAVHDYMWIPAIAGIILAGWLNPTLGYLWVEVVKLGLIGGMLALELVVLQLKVGEADVICVLLLAAAPYYSSLLGTLLLCIPLITAHFLYLKMRGKELKNLPLVGYLGAGFVGYACFALFLSLAL
jgi:hypothetical protein